MAHTHRERERETELWVDGGVSGKSRQGSCSCQCQCCRRCRDGEHWRFRSHNVWLQASVRLPKSRRHPPLSPSLCPSLLLSVWLSPFGMISFAGVVLRKMADNRFAQIHHESSTPTKKQRRNQKLALGVLLSVHRCVRRMFGGRCKATNRTAAAVATPKTPKPQNPKTPSI